MKKVLKTIGQFFIFRWIYRLLRPWQWLGVCVGAVVYVVVAYVPSVQTMAQGWQTRFIETSGLQVQNLLLEGRTHTEQVQVVEAIGLKGTGTSIFSIDVGEIQQRIEYLGWVKTARVSRIFPNTLYVVINERQPAVVLQRHGIFTLIDRDGVPISQDNIDAFSHLKVLVGQGAEKQVGMFLDLINTDTTLEPIVQSAVYVSKRRWDIILTNGIRVQMPEKNPARAWKELGRLAREKDLLARPIEGIDLRIEGRVNLQQKQKKPKQQGKDKPT